MIALTTVILALFNLLGIIEISWGLVLIPIYIEVIYWFLEYIEYDSRMIEIVKVRKRK
jgi:hypothetical protein